MKKIKVVRINEAFWRAMENSAHEVRAWPVWMGGEGYKPGKVNKVESIKSHIQREGRSAASR